MAVKAVTGDAVFTYTNGTHYAGWAFPDVNSGTSFASSIWVYLNNTTPFIVWSYDGSGYIRIEHDGTNWLFNLDGTTTIINAIVTGTWVHFAYTKSGDNHKVYYTVDMGHPTLKIDTTVSITFSFSVFTLRASVGNAVCSFKMYGTDHNISNENMAWGPQQSGILWGSFLRRRGDIYASHPIWGGPNWSSVNEWTTYPTWSDLGFQDDPNRLKDKGCSAWILPIGGIAAPNLSVSPSVVPFLSAIMKSTIDYWRPEDRQAVPLDAFVYGITYKGYHTQTNAPYTILSIDCWAKYISDLGVFYNQKRGSWDALGTEGAATYTYAPPPVGGENHPITIANMYDWQFGFERIYTNALGQGPPGPIYPDMYSAQGNLTYPVLFVSYIGGIDWPPEVPPEDPELTYVHLSQLPIEIAVGSSNLTGIYTFPPPTTPTLGTPRRDLYYNRDTPGPGSIAKKIPNPTIKTALIGE